MTDYAQSTHTAGGYAGGRTDTDDKTIAIVGYALLLLGFFTSGITSVIAVVLAYVRRDGAEPLPRSHLGFQISTFWIGFGGTLLGIALLIAMGVGFAVIGVRNGEEALEAGGGEVWSMIALGGMGVLAIIAANVAALVRSIYGLIKLGSDRPVGG